MLNKVCNNTFEVETNVKEKLNMEPTKVAVPEGQR